MPKFLDETGLAKVRDLVHADIANATVTASELDIHRVFRTEYAIDTSVMNGSASGDTSIWTEETAHVTIEPMNKFLLPDSITVTGATYNYNAISGVVALSEVASAVSIVAVCTAAPIDLVKGDMISFDSHGTGELQQFRVLKLLGGNQVRLLGMESPGNTKWFQWSSTAAFEDGVYRNAYEKSALHTLLNTTYYNSLHPSVQAAIVDQHCIQSAYNRHSSSDYEFCIKGYSYSWSYVKKTSQHDAGVMHVRSLDLDDFKDYFEITEPITLEGSVVNTWLFGAENPNPTTSIGLTTVEDASGQSSSPCYFYSDRAAISSQMFYSEFTARPVFDIDLTSISYIKE